MKQSRFPILKIASSAALFSLLAACSGMPSILGGSSTTAQTGSTTQRMADNVLSALCSGQPEQAVQILSLEPLASPTDRFFIAYAFEQSGRPAAARQLYAQLMQQESNERINIRCGGQTLANGTVSDVSAQRLVVVSQNLALLDADLRPKQRLHAGLPSTQPASRGPASSGSTYTGPAIPVTAPGSQSPFGQWFAHLASYMSLENAQKNRATLEGQFPALSGIIDQWEVNSGGRTAIRLGIRVENRADAQRLCQAVKSQGKYCAVIDTST